MIWAILFVFTLTLIVESLVMLEMKRSHENHLEWLRERVIELEADKRALTESLCRSEGKPFFQPYIKDRKLQPASDGWWDAMPEITVTEITDKT